MSIWRLRGRSHRGSQPLRLYLPPTPRPHPGSVGQDKCGPGGLGTVPEPGHGQWWGRVREGVAVQSPQITKAKSVPGKLAPNDRLEPRDRGQAACPCPLRARRLGGSGEGPEHRGSGRWEGCSFLAPTGRGYCSCGLFRATRLGSGSSRAEEGLLCGADPEVPSCLVSQGLGASASWSL